MFKDNLDCTMHLFVQIACHFYKLRTCWLSYIRSRVGAVIDF